MRCAIPAAVTHCAGTPLSAARYNTVMTAATTTTERRTRFDTAMREENRIDMQRQKDSNENTERDERKLTVNVETEGGNGTTTMELMKCVRELCGGLKACRMISENKYEMTMSHPKGKERLMEGFKIGETRIHARELINDELVVSFLNLPYYIEDREITEKLQSWGVSAASPIKRRMWPGTNVADGTRYLKVQFNKQVQSLPYSTKFNTVLGAEYFRVIHDKQMKVCRMCIQPGHILRECPEFQCHRCGIQGHYARECNKNTNQCALCANKTENCTCHTAETEGEMNKEAEDSGEASESDQSDDGTEECAMRNEAEDTGRTERVASARSLGTEQGQRGNIAKAERAAQPTPGTEKGDQSQPEQTSEKERTDQRREKGEKTDPKTTERRRRRAETGERRMQDGETHAETDEESPESPTVGSESDMELCDNIIQIRKRQNTERHMRINKKSKSKKKMMMKIT